MQLYISLQFCSESRQVVGRGWSPNRETSFWFRADWSGLSRIALMVKH